jgi:hypothetical protein
MPYIAEFLIEAKRDDLAYSIEGASVGSSKQWGN